MTGILAILGAAFYGSADFLGGFASRRESPIAVTTVAQAFGIIALVPLVLLFPGEGARQADLLWGAVGGVSGSLGVVALYAALSSGPMTLVAPVTASLAAAIPAIWDISTHGLPGPVTIIGLLLAFAAILVISLPDRAAASDDRITVRVLFMSAFAGSMFGMFFVLLGNTTPDAGLWPLVGARSTSLPILLLLALAKRQSLRIGPGVRLHTVGAGVLDMVANAFVLSAIQLGPLAVAAVLSSLYPGATALLAWWVLKERPDTRHKIGIVMALVAVALTAIP